MNNSEIDELASIPYEIIQDKALSTQDYLFKLIIIGDTGKNLSFILKPINRRRKKLPSFKGDGR